MKAVQIIVAAAFAATLSACGTAGRTNAVTEAQQRATPTFVVDERFVSDAELAERIRLVSLIEAETPAGGRQIQAEFFNTTGRFAQLQYAFRWYRQDGFEIDSNLSQWRTVGIQPADSARVTGTAPSADAVDFRLVIRRSR
ncbi:MAG: YcfL family protein [Planctomycetota bacterium]